MEEAIFINHSTCKKCMLCTEVCPNKILKKNESGEITYKPERKDLCFKCGNEDPFTRNVPVMILFLAENGEDISQDISIVATYGILAFIPLD